MTPMYMAFVGDVRDIAPDATITATACPGRELIVVEVSWPCNGMHMAVREGLDFYSLRQSVVDCEYLVYQMLLQRVKQAISEDKE
jgi:hypothetical protein